MSYELQIKFAPISFERFNDETWAPDRTMYGGDLKFLPSRSSVPLLVNHDDDQEIGRVHTLWRMDWVDGPWLMASATLDGEKPAWLKRGSRCSFNFTRLDSGPSPFASALWTTSGAPS